MLLKDQMIEFKHFARPVYIYNLQQFSAIGIKT